MPSLVVLVVDSVVHTNEVNEVNEDHDTLTFSYIRQLGWTKIVDFLFARCSAVYIVLPCCGL